MSCHDANFVVIDGIVATSDDEVGNKTDDSPFSVEHRADTIGIGPILIQFWHIIV